MADLAKTPNGRTQLMGDAVELPDVASTAAEMLGQKYDKLSRKLQRGLNNLPF